VRFLPCPEFPIAQFHFLSVVIKDVKRLGRLRKKCHVNERGVTGEYGAAPFDRDVEKNEGRARQNEVGGETKGPEHEPLEETVPTAM
jgi:hypothetical protein